jgi:hypothetical protein
VGLITDDLVIELDFELTMDALAFFSLNLLLDAVADDLLLLANTP